MERARVYRRVRRIVILVVGGTLLLAGAALIFLPGPGLLVLLAALALLGTEFAWARRLLRRARLLGRRVTRKTPQLRNEDPGTGCRQQAADLKWEIA